MRSSAKKAKNKVQSLEIKTGSIQETELPNLSRSCEITKIEAGQPVKYTITYDEIKNGITIGYGQFGIITKVYHETARLNLAVKKVSLMRMESNDKRNSQLMDYRILSTIGSDCNSIIKYYGAIFADGFVWILNELMDRSLDSFYLKSIKMSFKMPELFISKVAYAVVNALDFMKKNKTIHRDIKPSNILINYTGEIKLCDFGISGFSDNSLNFTQKGCKRYMAPEKYSNTGYDIKSDLWSLGITLIEIVTGENPYKNFDCDLLIYNHLSQNDTPKLDTSNFSVDLCDFVARCLVKLPEERASCSVLMKHRLITEYLDLPNDLEYIKLVIDQTNRDSLQ